MPATKSLQAFRTLTSQGYDLKYDGFFHSQWKVRKMLSSARPSGFNSISMYYAGDSTDDCSPHTVMS